MTPDAKALVAKVREAVSADFGQAFINSMTPDRGYDEVPIDNTLALFEVERRRLEIAMRAIEEAPHALNCQIGFNPWTGQFHECACWKSRVAAQLNTPTP